MLLQTNSYVVPREKRNEHARLLRRFRQTLLRLGCDHFEVYEQVGANWSADHSISRFVQILRFVDRKHQLAVQAAERSDPTAQAVIAEFCEMINFPIQQEKGLFAVGYYTSVLPYAPRRDSQGEVVSTVDQEGDPAPMSEAAAEDYTSEAEFTEVPGSAEGIGSDLLETPSNIPDPSAMANNASATMTEFSAGGTEPQAADPICLEPAPVENAAPAGEPETLDEPELFEPEEIIADQTEAGPTDTATEPAPLDLQAEFGEPLEMFDPIAEDKPLGSLDDLSALEDLEPPAILQLGPAAETPAEMPSSEHPVPADASSLPHELSAENHPPDKIPPEETSTEEFSFEEIEADRHLPKENSARGSDFGRILTEELLSGQPISAEHPPEHFSLDELSLEEIPAGLHEPIEGFRPADHVESFAPAEPVAEPAPVGYAAAAAPIEPIIPDPVMPAPLPIFSDAEPAAGQVPAPGHESIFDLESTNGHETAPPPPPELPGVISHDVSESHRWVTPAGDPVPTDSAPHFEQAAHHSHPSDAEPAPEEDLPELLTEEYVPEPLDDDFNIEAMTEPSEPAKVRTAAEESTESNGLIEAELAPEEVFEGTWEPSEGHADQPHAEKTDGGHRETADQPHGW